MLAGKSFSQFSDFCNSYDILSTVAGKGNIDDKEVNGWSVLYENGPAVDAELSRPHMAMADSVGNIYIADKDAHAIRKVDVNGIITTVAGTSIAGDNGDGLAVNCQLNAPNGLWVRKDGAFYILDLNNNKIRKVDTEGQMTTIVHDENGISLGRGLWVSEHEDTIWYASGSAIKQWISDSGISIFASGFGGLGNIVQSPDGAIIATDRVASKVFRIDQSGTVTHIAGNGSSIGNDGVPAIEAAFDEVRGVWCMSDGSYFLATHQGSQVWYVDVEGIAHLFLDGWNGDEYHSGDGENYKTPGYKISEARAVTVDYQGNVIITENDRGFIRKIEKKEVVSRLNKLKKNDHQLMAFPNPVIDRLSIRFEIEEKSEVEVCIIDQLGKIVAVFKNGVMNAGIHEFQWDRGETPTGIYLVRIKTDKQTCFQRISLMI